LSRLLARLKQAPCQCVSASGPQSWERRESEPLPPRVEGALEHLTPIAFEVALQRGRVALLELGRQLSARRGPRPPSALRSFGADRPCCRRQSHAPRNGRRDRAGF